MTKQKKVDVPVITTRRIIFKLSVIDETTFLVCRRSTTEEAEADVTSILVDNTPQD